MANSARDPYWHAAVRREVLDHPAAQAAIEDKCSTCHMPMARFDAAAAGGQGEVFANLAPAAPQHALAADGVSCTVCHQIAADGLRRARELRRRLRDRSARATPRRLRAARNRRGPAGGDALGGDASRRASALTSSGRSSARRATRCSRPRSTTPGRRSARCRSRCRIRSGCTATTARRTSCQSCHMPEVAADTPIASVLGAAAAATSRSTRSSAATRSCSASCSRYRGELGVTALAAGARSRGRRRRGASSARGRRR